jgi:hypothetical protein
VHVLCFAELMFADRMREREIEGAPQSFVNPHKHD